MRVAKLSDELETAVIHVAAHMLARRQLGIRALNDAPVSINVPWVGRPSIRSARVTLPKKGVNAGAAAKYLVACYAGLEAEAMWLQETSNVTCRVARKMAKHANRGGVRACIREARKISNISWRSARRKGHQFASNHWKQIDRLADQLWLLAGGEGLAES